MGQTRLHDALALEQFAMHASEVASATRSLLLMSVPACANAVPASARTIAAAKADFMADLRTWFWLLLQLGWTKAGLVRRGYARRRRP